MRCEDFIPYADLTDDQRAEVDADRMFHLAAERGWGLDRVFGSRLVGAYVSVTESPYCTPDLLEAIAGSVSNEEVLASVAGNPRCPAPVLERFSADSRCSVRDAVAGNPSTPPAVLAGMVESPDYSPWGAWKSERGHRVYRYTCGLVAANPSCPPETRDLIARRKGYLYGLCGFLRYADLDFWQLMDFSFASTALAGKMRCAREGLGIDRIAADSDPCVRCEAARNGSCPPDVLAALAGDPDPDVRVAAFSNAACPVEASAGSLAGMSAAQRVRIASGTASVGLLERLASDKSVGVRCSAAANRCTPFGKLEVLASDSSVKVRRTVAFRLADRDDVPARVRAGILDLLARDADPEVRSAVASDPSCPQGLLGELVRDADPSVRASAAGSPSAPAGVLDALGSDGDALVRLAVAGNPSCPRDMLDTLAADSDRYVSREALCNLAQRAAR